jgi:PST family polysaccharide transporter/lipopolysaccharide exporter
VPLIQVLAVFGIIRSLHGPTGSIYLALGKPRFVAGFQCVQLTIAIGLMFLLLPAYGAVGAAYALLVGAAAAMACNYGFAMRELQLSVSDLARSLWRPLVSAAAMIGVVVAIGPLWAGDNGVATNVLRLAVLLATATLVYLAVVMLCWFLARRPEGPESQIVRLGANRLGLRTGA